MLLKRMSKTLAPCGPAPPQGGSTPRLEAGALPVGRGAAAVCGLLPRMTPGTSQSDSHGVPRRGPASPGGAERSPENQ